MISDGWYWIRDPKISYKTIGPSKWEYFLDGWEPWQPAFISSAGVQTIGSDGISDLGPMRICGVDTPGTQVGDPIKLPRKYQ